MVVGAIAGVEYSLLYTVLDLLLDPAWAGGTGSVGLSVFGAMVGLAVGIGYGFVVGVVTCAAMAAAWAMRAPQSGAIVVGSSAMTATAATLVMVTVGSDPATLLVPLWTSTWGVAGVILLTWLAGLRPHDYWDIVEKRSYSAR
ncbi:hypothetical protein [Herbiconiux ginsengi]|uniref:Uncharacterized protein n=1 Tax=Herbiconiux ginsengi TaxID=381665 RepID=A0A1H3QLW7_9MICO|nr:hypothetical protein [Herbiconiux ginsengi]SDZ14367.1 hypothetical protein SAMN05216554_2618 [Herbiconiux ginsengi]